MHSTATAPHTGNPSQNTDQANSNHSGMMSAVRQRALNSEKTARPVGRSGADRAKHALRVERLTLLTLARPRAVSTGPKREHRAFSCALNVPQNGDMPPMTEEF